MVVGNYQEVGLHTTTPEKISKHSKHKNPNYHQDYYLKNKQKLLLKRKLHHSQTYQKKPSKSPSLFSINRQKNLLSCLNKHHITVPVPRFLKVKHLKSQLTQIQTKNNNLFTKLTKTEQEKAKLEVIATQEKQRADNYQQQLRNISKVPKQWQKNTVLSETKINYYQQLEKEQTAQIEQPLLKPPNKYKSC